MDPVEQVRLADRRRPRPASAPDRRRLADDNPDLQILQEAQTTRFGAMLFRIRERLGWTQEQLADLAGLDRHAVTAIECGRVDPKLSTLNRLLYPFGLILQLHVTRAPVLPVVLPIVRGVSTRPDLTVLP